MVPERQIILNSCPLSYTERKRDLRAECRYKICEILFSYFRKLLSHWLLRSCFYARNSRLLGGWPTFIVMLNCRCALRLQYSLTALLAKRCFWGASTWIHHKIRIRKTGRRARLESDYQIKSKYENLNTVTFRIKAKDIFKTMNCDNNKPELTK